MDWDHGRSFREEIVRAEVRESFCYCHAESLKSDEIENDGYGRHKKSNYAEVGSIRD